jgi:hypothetical protein
MNVVSPLVAYGLAGLRRCWLPDRQTWSHKYHLDGRMPPNESIPHSDLYYSLNVMLGLARVRPALAAEPYDLAPLLESLCSAAARHPMRNGAWGMALWAAAELDLDTPAAAMHGLSALGVDPSCAVGWTAQDIGLTVSGACAQARRDPSQRPLARVLGSLLLTHFRGSGALFRDSGRGGRRHFATFATQVYAALALYHYGELFEDARAIEAANSCAAKLIALQGAAGEWPWFYGPHSDRVLDPYEVYSVHQHGMAPALLHHAVQHGVPGAREAIVKGFGWIFGANQMGLSMLVPNLQLIYRSQARRGVHATRQARLARATIAVITGRDNWSASGDSLRVTQEMRSYEFGWLLWSFGNSNDYPELTERIEFQNSNGCPPTTYPVAESQ